MSHVEATVEQPQDKVPANRRTKANGGWVDTPARIAARERNAALAKAKSEGKVAEKPKDPAPVDPVKPSAMLPIIQWVSKHARDDVKAPTCFHEDLRQFYLKDFDGFLELWTKHEGFSKRQVSGSGQVVVEAMPESVVVDAGTLRAKELLKQVHQDIEGELKA